MRKRIGWILIILGGLFCVDGMICIPAILIADHLLLGERIIGAVFVIAFAIGGAMICRKGFELKAGTTPKRETMEISMPDGVKIRRISKKYYDDAHRNRVAPSFTEIRDGFVHQYHIFVFQCEECHQYFQYRSDAASQVLEKYENKVYCRDCWNKKQHEIYEACPECKKPLSYFERRNQYNGMCRDCWVKVIAKQREKYREYQNFLEEYLREQGVMLNPSDTDGLDETGRPSDSVKDKKIDILPLRDNEYALYLFEAGEGIFAFPSHGIGLRYIKAPSRQKFYGVAGGHNRMLAAGTDGRVIYILTDKGKLFMTRSDSPENDNGDHTESVQAIDVYDFCMKTAEDTLSEKQIEDAVTDFCSNGIACVNDSIYYDPAAKKFFRVLVDGNYYHGYDVDYMVQSKKAVMESLVRYHFSIDGFVDACRAGEVPMLVILSRLSYEEGPYSPPDHFGYGKHFI